MPPMAVLATLDTIHADNVALLSAIQTLTTSVQLMSLQLHIDLTALLARYPVPVPIHYP